MAATLLAGLAFVVLGVVLPGIALQRLARVRLDMALVIPLGTAAVALAYFLGILWQRPWLGLGLVAALALAGLALAVRGGMADGPSPGGAIVPIVAILVVLAVTQYPWNRRDDAGDFLLDPLVTYDSGFHVGVAHELALGYPPQVPGLSGFPLGYHLGTDLVRAAALKWARVHPYDSLTRIDVTLWAIGLVLALRAAAARLGASAAALMLVGFTPLLTDLSWVLGAAPNAHWWADLLKGNLLLSLAYANPVMPALGLALGALLALSRWDAGEGHGWLFLAAAQATAVPAFKVFLGAQLLLGLGVAFLVTRHRLGVLAVAVGPLVVTALLALGQGGSTVEVAFDPLNLVHTPEDLGLEAFGGVRLVAWVLVWIAASVGVRFVGIAPAARALRGGTTLGVALAAMALSGWPLGLAFRVSAPLALPGQKVINDASYLVEQSGPLLWLFTAMALGRMIERAGGARVLALGLCLLSVPSTLQYVAKKAGTEPDRMPAAVVRAMDALAKATAPGDVILERPNARYPPPPVVLIGRRVPFERFTPYLTQFAAPDDLERRHEDVVRFLRTRDPAEALVIARSLGAQHVCLFGGDRVRFPTLGLLQRVHEEAGARCYRLR